MAVHDVPLRRSSKAVLGVLIALAILFPAAGMATILGARASGSPTVETAARCQPWTDLHGRTVSTDALRAGEVIFRRCSLDLRLSGDLSALAFEVHPNSLAAVDRTLHRGQVTSSLALLEPRSMPTTRGRHRVLLGIQLRFPDDGGAPLTRAVGALARALQAIEPSQRALPWRR
jgi:hypothetical protein